MHSRREFLKNLAGVTMGILFVNYGVANAAHSFHKAAGTAKRRRVTVAGRRVKTIDIHGHCFVPEIWELIKDFKEAQYLKQFVDGPEVPKINVNTLEFRLRQMDEWGIDIQAASIPPEYCYWADRDLAGSLVRIQNHKIAELCAAYPDRFVGIGALALQHPDLAIEQMKEGVKKMGLRGFLPSYSGRSDRCFGEPHSCKTGLKRPSEYLKELYYDSLVFTKEGMRHMIAEVGADRIVLGTDYPFGWESDAAGYVLGVPGLSNDQKKAILSGNAAKLLKINL